MLIGEFVINLIGDLIELIVEVIVRSFGWTEAKVKTVKNSVLWILVGIFSAGLFYLTLKYS